MPIEKCEIIVIKSREIYKNEMEHFSNINKYIILIHSKKKLDFLYLCRLKNYL
jgi:hypothetical protein